MSKILFLSGSDENDFYNQKRNEVQGVNATSIFKSNSIVNKIMRKVICKISPRNLRIIFNTWKNFISDYDLFIIAASPYSPYIAQYIRSKTDKRIIHWYWNPIVNEIKPDKLNEYSAEIWSFDKQDCEQYQLNYIPTYYFSNITLPQNEIINDVYFMGADKGRLDSLLKIKKILEDRDVKVNFHITKSKNSKDSEYVFQERIPYQEVLEQISKSKVILDYVQENQSGLTQRPMESIFFNKKLITNDINIDQNDFYDRNNIFILGKDDIENINKFINTPYKPINIDIIRRYDFSNWIDSFSKEE